MVAGLNGYLDFNGGGWVEWVFGWVDDGGWEGCVGFLREMIV